MAENSKIEWTHHTANLWWGCTVVHEGCDNCYASTLSKRWNFDLWGNNKPRRLIKKAFFDLEKFQRIAKSKGEIHRVFVGSMMDIFEKPMPLVDHEGNPAIDWADGSAVGTDYLRDELFHNISIGLYPNLMFLLLTKRPSNINKMIPVEWLRKAPENVMFGTSPVSQKTFDTLVPQLLNVEGKRFLSMEPQLEQINLTNKLTNRQVQGIHWIIQGGESGHHRRPFNIDWAYSMYDQCVANGIPYFFKQIDKVIPLPDDLLIREFPI